MLGRLSKKPILRRAKTLSSAMASFASASLSVRGRLITGGVSLSLPGQDREPKGKGSLQEVVTVSADLTSACEGMIRRNGELGMRSAKGAGAA